MNKKRLKYTVIKDGISFVAKMTEIELASQGKLVKKQLKTFTKLMNY